MIDDFEHDFDRSDKYLSQALIIRNTLCRVAKSVHTVVDKLINERKALVPKSIPVEPRGAVDECDQQLPIL